MKKVLNSTLISLASFVLAVAIANTLAHAQTAIFSFDSTDGSYPSFPGILAQGQDGNLYGTTPQGGIGYCGPNQFGCGVVFEITPDGTETVLIALAGAPGGLTLGMGGNFYGAFPGGLNYCLGGIFKITPDGKATRISTFSYCPVAPPILGTDGSFYGTTFGFEGQAGLVYRITPSGTFTQLGSIPYGSQTPLIETADGDFYGLTTYGGNPNCYQGCGTIFKVTRGGIISNLYTFDGTDAEYPMGLLQGTDGGIYGIAEGGGAYGLGLIFKLTERGINVLHAFGGFPADGIAPVGMLQASDGNLYGVTGEGGNTGCALGCGTIFELSPVNGYSVRSGFSFTNGVYPFSTPVQHTNGKIYGTTFQGGALNQGVVFSIDLGLPQFVRLVSNAGRIGQTGGILGQGFTGTSNVSFNGILATFTVVSDTYLTATVPPGATTGYVTVTTPSGTLTSNVPFRVIP